MIDVESLIPIAVLGGFIVTVFVAFMKGNNLKGTQKAEWDDDIRYTSNTSR